MFVATTIKNSAVNGPGNRYTIWFQGCSRKCPGCANQHLQTFRHNLPESNVQDIVRDVRAQGKAIEGISLTGGEPLEQNTVELTQLCKELFSDYSIMLISGYTLAEIAQRTEHLLCYVDILVDGPFVQELLDETNAWRGSTNQTIHFLSERSQKYKGMESPAACEIRFNADRINITGFNVPEFLKEGM